METFNVSMEPEVPDYSIVGQIKEPDTISIENGRAKKQLPNNKETMGHKEIVSFAKTSKR